jgi:diguanylate cyclase (GGDEF)-like protein
MVRNLARRLAGALPAGYPLTAREWERRHRVILWVLGAHALLLFAMALWRGFPLEHALVDAGALAVATAVAAYRGLPRRVRAAVATLGAMGSSSVLVHLLGGLTEAHFHFFVMLFVIVLYQDWLAFLLASVFVLVEHAVVGVIAPQVVYSHGAAQSQPIKWAAIHGLFIAGAAVAAVANWRLTERAQQASHAAVAELADQASRDQLTGVLNRGALARHVERAMAEARDGGRHALCLVNVDRFGALDEAVGDGVLIQLADLLVAQAGPDAHVARLAADRFVVLLADCGPDEAVRRADTMRAAVAETRFAVMDGEVTVTVSVGVAPVTALETSVDEVIQAARAACHTAKDRGRNRVELFRADDDALSRRRVEAEWAQTLITAISDDRLELYHQPIVPVSRGSDGHLGELLLRLRLPDGTLVAPGAFLPAASRYNLLGAVDRWVVSYTFATLAARYPAGPDHSGAGDLYFVNLSGPSIGDPEFLAHVRARLAATGVSPQLVCFEITESVAIEDLAAAAAFVRELRGLGFRFALDDFGNGLSSFAYLKGLPVDFLKIDGNFVRGIDDSTVDRVMVSAINDLGHDMGLLTIAEFVEDAQAMQRLRAIGVDFAQGYHIARPGPFLQWLDERGGSSVGAALPAAA